MTSLGMEISINYISFLTASLVLHSVLLQTAAHCPPSGGWPHVPAGWDDVQVRGERHCGHGGGNDRTITL